MTRDDIQKEFDNFIEFPTEEKSFVTTTSALLFAETIAAMAVNAERQRSVKLSGIKGDVLAMAADAGLTVYEGSQDRILWDGSIRAALERFTALVAAAEREACAMVCEAIEADRWALYKGRPPYQGTEDGRASEYTQGQSDGASDCVAAIKARGNL